MKSQLFYGVEFPHRPRRISLTKCQLVLVILVGFVWGVCLALVAIEKGVL